MNTVGITGFAVFAGVLGALAVPTLIAGAILAVCCAACGRPSC